MKFLISSPRIGSLLGAAVLVLLSGCSPQPDSPEASPPPSQPSAASKPSDTDPAGTKTDQAETKGSDADVAFEAEAYEASAEELLAARLPLEETSQGWVRLFDGHTMFGWVIAGEANWRILDGALVADQGQQCLLTTTTRWDDFELELEFQSDPETNSGVFLRTEIDSDDPATDCLEVNIAPPEHPYPTGSLVARKKGSVFQGDPTQWQTMNVVAQDASLSVKINGEVICESDQAGSPRSGHIGLQFRSGRVAFRNIRVRPLGLHSLLDAELSQWKQYDDMPGSFTVNEEGQLVVDGGKQQLESLETYGDFTLLTDYKMEDPKSNSGIFFRAIPGDVMMGYECQVSNETVDDDPLQPADGGPGGIFRRQDARIVAGQPERWNSILLLANGPHFATWVNGLQVTDVNDDRQPDKNPRKGLRLEPGTLMIQGHDETTKATYRKLEVKPSMSE